MREINGFILSEDTFENNYTIKAELDDCIPFSCSVQYYLIFPPLLFSVELDSGICLQGSSRTLVKVCVTNGLHFIDLFTYLFLPFSLSTEEEQSCEALAEHRSSLPIFLPASGQFWGPRWAFLPPRSPPELRNMQLLSWGNCLPLHGILSRSTMC